MVRLNCRILWVLTVIGVLSEASKFRHDSQQTRYDGHRLFRVTPSNEYQLKALRDLEASGMDFWSSPFLNNRVSFRVPPAHLEVMERTMANLSLNYDVVVDSIQDLLDGELHDHRTHRREAPDDVVVGNFPRHSQINLWLEQLTNRYPHLATTIDIGTTFEDRTQKVIKIGSQIQRNKTSIWIDAGMHAREWITVATLIYVIDKLLEGYGEDDETTKLLDNFNFFMLPVANPDGYEFTFTDRLWRKTRTNYGGCMGADPNRNFDNDHGRSEENHSPCSNTYPGPHPFSEKCSKNIAQFLKNSKNSFVLYLSLHSHAQMWLLPWAHTTEKPDDNEELLRVAQIGKMALLSVNGRVFTVGSPAKVLYMASGVSYDWAKAQAGIKYSYTLELYPSLDTPGGFIVKREDIKPSGEEILAGIKAVGFAMNSLSYRNC